ncbi:hypothetical protein A6E15_17070 [Natrinema saccharevitans]|uniref:Uncharacterized protein n=1 Tax=Natrinema saccharevitans TaxID=301967 RepID=A0A1S8B178_9EURY|nr:hypothetical protein A6E15_17070 [Natrinema saccharevitans]
MATVPAAAQSTVTVDDGQVTVGTGTATEDVKVDNTGNESVSIDVSSPTGIDVDPSQRTVPAGSSETITLEISADDDASGGTVTVSTGDDSETIEVTRPPIAGLEDEPLDVGEVLVGGQASGEVDIEQIGGDGSWRYVSASVDSSDPDASLNVYETGGTLEWTATVDDDAAQHEDLEWEVELVPDGNDDAARTVDVEGEVIYPPRFGDVELDDDQVTFDEPRDSTATVTETIDLEVENAGDLEMDLETVTASAPSGGIDVSITDRPETIDGQSTGTVEVAVAADTGLDEGAYDISGTARASDATVSDANFDGTITVDHAVTLETPDRIDIGDVPIGESTRQTASIGETLGYQNVEDLEITLEDGPDSWLTIEEAPSRLDAGGSRPVVFQAAFDTDAELGTSYEWTYAVDGTGVEEETVTVTASPVPVNLDPIRNDVEAYDGPVAEGTLSMVETMDTRMRDGDIEDDSITTVISFGTASSLYLESMDAASERQAAGEYDQAQQEVVQAAAAYNTMTLYADELDGAAFRSDTEPVLSAAESDLDAGIQEQAQHYESRLESENVSLIEKATIKRQLARVTLLQGDDERASALEQEAQSAFENYTQAVSDGERARQRADETWETMESEQFVTVAGQPLLLNPAEYDTYTDRVDEMNVAYENATATFEQAGETSRVEAVESEYADRTATLEVTRWSLLGATGVYGLLVIGIVVRTARGTYQYLRDARASVSGDFLV